MKIEPGLRVIAKDNLIGVEAGSEFVVENIVTAIASAEMGNDPDEMILLRPFVSGFDEPQPSIVVFEEVFLECFAER